MSSVFGADTSHAIVATIRIAGIGVVAVFGNDVVTFLTFRQAELTFSVGNPNAELTAREASKHHTVILWNGQPKERTLELVRVVVQHAGSLLMFGID